LQSSRKSMPPQATTLRPYTVQKKPQKVVKNFQKSFRPWTVASCQGNFGGKW